MAYRYHVGEGNIRRGYVRYSADNVKADEDRVTMNQGYPIAIVYLPEDNFVKALEVAKNLIRRSKQHDS